MTPTMTAPLDTTHLRALAEAALAPRTADTEDHQDYLTSAQSAFLAHAPKLVLDALEAARQERDEAADAANDATGKLGAAWLALELPDDQAQKYGDDIGAAIRDQISVQVEAGDALFRQQRQRAESAEMVGRMMLAALMKVDGKLLGMTYVEPVQWAEAVVAALTECRAREQALRAEIGELRELADTLHDLTREWPFGHRLRDKAMQASKAYWDYVDRVERAELAVASALAATPAAAARSSVPSANG